MKKFSLFLLQFFEGKCALRLSSYLKETLEPSTLETVDFKKVSRIQTWIVETLESALESLSYKHLRLVTIKSADQNLSFKYSIILLSRFVCWHILIIQDTSSTGRCCMIMSITTTKTQSIIFTSCTSSNCIHIFHLRLPKITPRASKCLRYLKGKIR